MAEWSNAAVLKTVEGHTSGGSNPSSSAIHITPLTCSEGFYFFFKIFENLFAIKLNRLDLIEKIRN